MFNVWRIICYQTLFKIEKIYEKIFQIKFSIIRLLRLEERIFFSQNLDFDRRLIFEKRKFHFKSNYLQVLDPKKIPTFEFKFWALKFGPSCMFICFLLIFYYKGSSNISVPNISGPGYQSRMTSFRNYWWDLVYSCPKILST